MTPHKCPICRGNGIVPKGFYTATGDSWVSDGIAESCRACTGTGIIWSKPDNYFPGYESEQARIAAHICEFNTAGFCSKCTFKSEGRG